MFFKKSGFVGYKIVFLGGAELSLLFICILEYKFWGGRMGKFLGGGLHRGFKGMAFDFWRSLALLGYNSCKDFCSKKLSLFLEKILENFSKGIFFVFYNFDGGVEVLGDHFNHKKKCHSLI
jgi:hypothetical protein